MKELNDFVQNKLNEMANDGALKALIERQVESLVANSVRELFQSYSPLSESLKNSLEKGLSVNFEEIDYASYNAIMLDAVKSHMDKYFGEQVLKDLNVQLESILGAPPAKIDLGELVDNMVKIIRKHLDSTCDYDNESYYTNIIVSAPESSYGQSLKIHTESSISHDNKELVHLFLGDDGSSIRVNHKHKQSFNPTVTYGVEERINAYIFKLYAAKTQITGWDNFDPEDHNDYCEADA